MDFFDTVGRWSTACLRLLPAEVAHDLGMFALERHFLDRFPTQIPTNHGVALSIDVPGIGLLKNPIGLAAGFDKNARCPAAFERMGFGFLEMGTVTPRPQPGNPKPRLFREEGQRAIINRMGFNSDGSDVVARRMLRHKWSQFQIPLGFNVGKNKETPAVRAIDDYMAGAETFANYCSYLVINISSPNTPGLRDLATPEFIRDLAARLLHRTKKCWIKLDPDMDRKALQKLIEAIKSEGYGGVILSNTHRVESPQAGGLSGHPLLSQSNTILEWAWEVHKGTLPMIASGGVLSGIDAFHKLARGASAVQIYTALVYRGPGAVLRICEELSLELKLRGFSAARDAIGTFYP